MVGSMGQAGSAGDNPAMESFFMLLQRNVLDRRRWDSRDELRIAIFTWIERTYHRRRRHAALGRLTPIEYEIIMTHPPPWPPDPTCHRITRQSQQPARPPDHPLDTAPLLEGCRSAPP
jgi:putative transposase